MESKPKRVSSPSTPKQPTMSEADDFDLDSDNPFNEPRCGSDVALVVEGKKLHVHKGVLSVHSPVFRTMFTSSFSEKDASEVKFPDNKYEAMIHFLLHMYPVHSLKDIASDDVLTAVLPLAHEYQAKHVLLKCTAYIQRQIPSLKYKDKRRSKLHYHCEDSSEESEESEEIEESEENEESEYVRALHFLYLCEKYDLTQPFNGVLQQTATCPIDRIQTNEHFKMLTMPTQINLLIAKCQVAEVLIEKNKK